MIARTISWVRGCGIRPCGDRQERKWGLRGAGAYNDEASQVEVPKRRVAARENVAGGLLVESHVCACKPKGCDFLRRCCIVRENPSEDDDPVPPRRPQLPRREGSRSHRREYGILVDPDANPDTAQGALGVGAALVRILHSAGAHVYFGDILTEPGGKLASSLASNSNASSTAHFRHLDVTSYSSNLALFRTAFEAHNRIDHAIAVAGIGEQGNMFDPALTIDSVQEEPEKSVSVVDVNLKGQLYFSRLASVYLRQGEGGQDKSLTLVSSVAGFREDPGLYVYTASKHGVMGLMRSLRAHVSRFLGQRTMS